MRKPHVGLTAEGHPYLFVAAFSTLVFAVLGLAIPALLGLVVTLLVANFFRDPERIIPNRPGQVVCPADGKIIGVDAAPDPFTGEPRKRICIFMNVFNVHVNRAPVSGVVKDMLYFPGKFFNASFDKASTDNERLSLSLQAEDGGLFSVTQIAGLLARRIVCYVDPGEALVRGMRFGMIKFGSRVDVHLPEDYDILATVGDKVYAGQTVLAQKRDLKAS